MYVVLWALERLPIANMLWSVNRKLFLLALTTLACLVNAAMGTSESFKGRQGCRI